MTALMQKYAALGCHYPEPTITIHRRKMTDAQRAAHRKQCIARYYEKRSAFLASGLTTNGKPRVRGQYRKQLKEGMK